MLRGKGCECTVQVVPVLFPSSSHQCPMEFLKEYCSALRVVAWEKDEG